MSDAWLSYKRFFRKTINIIAYFLPPMVPQCKKVVLSCKYMYRIQCSSVFLPNSCFFLINLCLIKIGSAVMVSLIKMVFLTPEPKTEVFYVCLEYLSDGIVSPERMNRFWLIYFCLKGSITCYTLIISQLRWRKR